MALQASLQFAWGNSLRSGSLAKASGEREQMSDKRILISSDKRWHNLNDKQVIHKIQSRSWSVDFIQKGEEGENLAI